MAGGDEGFLSRWSRLKRKDGQAKEASAPPAPVQDAPAPAPIPEEGEPPPDLPDIASLTKDSDFTVFLRAGVPEHLQRDALRALWKSDPIFSHQDGLTDYAEDFTNPEVVGDAVKTAWKIGRGFLEDDPEQTVAESTEKNRPETSDESDSPEKPA